MLFMHHVYTRIAVMHGARQTGQQRLSGADVLPSRSSSLHGVHRHMCPHGTRACVLSLSQQTVAMRDAIAREKL